MIPSKHPLVDTLVLFDETFTHGEKPQEGRIKEMVLNSELSQAKSTISLESSAPVPEDALGLMQKK